LIKYATGISVQTNDIVTALYKRMKSAKTVHCA